MDLRDLEEEIEFSQEPRALWQALVRFVRAHGAREIAYHHIPPIGAPDASVLRLNNSGFPPEWVEFYLAARASGNAPITIYAQTNGEPVYWDEIAELKALGPEERVHLAALAEAGFLHGLAIPVFGPNGRNGMCGLAFEADAPRPSRMALVDLHWACQAAHLRYCALLLPTLGDPPALSRRESEVLGWVARGKSNAAIGSILGISAHTVDAHLRRIYLKMGVFDRISAALRGLGFGLIQSDV